MAEKIDQELLPDGLLETTYIEGDEVITHRQSDVEPALKLAHAERVASSGQKMGELHKIGHIPANVWAQMLLDGRSNDPIAIAKWLECNPAFKSVDKRYMLQ